MRTSSGWTTSCPAGSSDSIDEVSTRRGGVLAAVVDQALSSGTNFLTAVLAARLLTPESYGSVVIALSVAYSAVGLGRTLIGDALLSFAPELGREGDDGFARAALSASAALGVAVGVVCAAVGLLLGDLRILLLVVAACVGFAVFQDACRYVFLARHRPDLALACDAVWAGAQALAVAGLLLRDTSSPELVLATWGFGAAVSAVYGGVVAGFRWASPRVWLQLSRRLTGWLLAGGVIGQLQNQAIVFIVALAAGEVQLAGFRSAQLVTLMPVAALLVAVSSLVVPRMSRAASDGDLGRLRDVTRSLAVRFGLGSIPAAGVLLVAGGPLLAGLFGQRYDDFSPVIAPFAVSIVVLAVTAPLSAGLRAVRDGRSLFTAQAAMTLTCLPLTWFGAEVAGARGAAWGVAGAIGVQLLMTGMLLRSRLSAASATR